MYVIARERYNYNLCKCRVFDTLPEIGTHIPGCGDLVQLEPFQLDPEQPHEEVYSYNLFIAVCDAGPDTTEYSRYYIAILSEYEECEHLHEYGGQIVTDEQFDEINESEYVQSVEGVGPGSAYPDCTLYAVQFHDGSEMFIYG